MLMVTRPIKKVTYRKELPPINSHDPSTWSSCGVIWQVKYIIYPPAENAWTPN